MKSRRIIYNVTVKIDSQVETEWLHWMNEHHIPDVLGTRHFDSVQINKILHDDDDGGVTYAFQYTCPDMQSFNTYREKFAEALQKDHQRRFGGRYVAFRTLMEIVDVVEPPKTGH